MQNMLTYNQTGLGRLAAVLLRQYHPLSADAGRTALKNALGVYTADSKLFDSVVSDYFRGR
jgi:hypothetical protein